MTPFYRALLFVLTLVIISLEFTACSGGKAGASKDAPQVGMTEAEKAKQRAELKKLDDDLDAAITQVAKRLDLDLVMSDGIAYALDGIEITSLVEEQIKKGGTPSLSAPVPAQACPHGSIKLGVVHIQTLLASGIAAGNRDTQLRIPTNPKVTQIPCTKAAIATIKIPKLMLTSLQFRSTQTKIRQDFKDDKTRLIEQEKKIKIMEEDYRKNSKSFSDADKQRIQAEYVALRKAFDGNREDLVARIADRRSGEIARIERAIQDKVQGLAEVRHLDLVLSQGVAYSKPHLDLTKDLSQKLDQDDILPSGDSLGTKP